MKKFRPNIELLEDLEFGIHSIAFTGDPAIEAIGFTLNKNSNSITKRVKFSTEKQYIIAPLLRVMDIYRFDDEEYYLELSYELNKALYVQLMKKMTLDTKISFNLEHTNKEIESSIVYLQFVEGQEEIEYIKAKYKYDAKIGDVMLVTHIPDYSVFSYLKEEGITGYSIEAAMQGIMVEMNKQKNKKVNMSKKFIIKKSKLSAEISEVKFDSIDYGQAVTVIDIDGNEIKDFTGDLVLLDENENPVSVSVEKGLITVIEGKTKEETLEEVKEDEKKEETLEDEKKEEVKEDEKLEGEFVSIEEFNSFKDQIIAKIAELETLISKKENEDDIDETIVDSTLARVNRINSILKFKQ